MAATKAKKINFVVNDNNTLSNSLQQLINQYNSTGVYQRKTAGQIKAQAQNEYGSYYDQLRLAAQQANERSDLALQQQRAGLQDTYDRQRQESEKQYQRAYSQADRQMLSRGMQRSSYTAQVLANLSQQGAEAQQTLWDAQANAEGNIDAQRTQLAEQLAAQMQQYDVSQQQDILKRISELEDQEYQRGNADMQYRDSLATQIYSFLQQKEAADVQQQQYKEQLAYQKERDKIADQQWKMQFDESKRQFEVQQAAKKSSGGGGSGGYKKPTTPTTPAADPNQQTTDAYKEWLKSMGLDPQNPDGAQNPPTTGQTGGNTNGLNHQDGTGGTPDSNQTTTPPTTKNPAPKAGDKDANGNSSDLPTRWMDDSGSIVDVYPDGRRVVISEPRKTAALEAGALGGLFNFMNGLPQQNPTNPNTNPKKKPGPKNGAGYTV